MLRGVLREELGIGEIQAFAARARVSVRQAGGFTSKQFYLSHPAFGEFLRLTVLRGQSHVVDLQFSSPSDLVPLHFLVGMGTSLADRAAQRSS